MSRIVVIMLMLKLCNQIFYAGSADGFIRESIEVSGMHCFSFVFVLRRHVTSSYVILFHTIDYTSLESFIYSVTYLSDLFCYL